METATIFMSNRNQAIRLPKAAALPDNIKRVDVVIVGNTRIISPAGDSWDQWFEMSEKLTDDCFANRDQPAHQERDAF
jgi:antitoxin VapB